MTQWEYARLTHDWYFDIKKKEWKLEATVFIGGKSKDIPQNSTDERFDAWAQRALNDLGKEGWELVHVESLNRVVNMHGFDEAKTAHRTFWLKRPRQ